MAGSSQIYYKTLESMCKKCELTYQAALQNFRWRSKALQNIQAIIDALIFETSDCLDKALTGEEIQELMKKQKRIAAFETLKPSMLASRDLLRDRVVKLWQERRYCEIRERTATQVPIEAVIDL